MIRNISMPRLTLWGVWVSGLKFNHESRWIFRAALVFMLMASGCACSTANAQANEWTWIGGSSSVPTGCSYPIGCGQAGVYGTQKVGAQANMPGGRSAANNWTARDGRLWLFAGLGVDSAGTPGGLDDLWVLDPSTVQWTWMGGSNTLPTKWGSEPPVFGTKGVASVGNWPGSRAYSNQWTDSSGNFWLFGAGSLGTPNDLWSFQPLANQWTWVGGESSVPHGVIGASGIYTSNGTPDTPRPGTRGGAYSCSDAAGNQWLFGGSGVDSVGNQGLENDLWVYNSTLGKWAWLAGSKTVLPDGYTGATGGGPTPVYGTQGIPAAGNTPGGREGGVCWVDSGGNLWIFGGYGQHLSGMTVDWSDMWEFNPLTKLWTWMSGTDEVTSCPLGQNFCGNPGVYGNLGTPAEANVPGARVNASTWTDLEGNFWLFGGTGFDAKDRYGMLNDLWEFSPVTRQWAWQGGSSTTSDCVPPLTSLACGNIGVYGTKGVADTVNTPGGRDSAMSWVDAYGNLWLFGGEGYDGLGQYGDLNDLWRIEPASIGLPATADPTFSVASGTYASAQTVSISDPTLGARIYFTTNGTPPTVASEVYSTPLSVTKTEVVEAIAVADGHSASRISSGAYVLPVRFAIGAAPDTLRLNAGTSGTVVVTVTPQNGFSAPVTFSCAGLPAGATCAFAPASVTPAGGTVSTTLTISAPANKSAAVGVRPSLAPTMIALGAVAFAWKRRRGSGALLLALVLAMFSALVACGGGTGGGSSGGGGGSQATTSSVTLSGLTPGEFEETTVTLVVN